MLHGQLRHSHNFLSFLNRVNDGDECSNKCSRMPVYGMHVYDNPSYNYSIQVQICSLFDPCIVCCTYYRRRKIKEKDQAFVSKTILMVYSIRFFGKSASKGVCLINIFTYSASVTFSSHQICAKCSRASEGNHRTWCKKAFKFVSRI